MATIIHIENKKYTHIDWKQVNWIIYFFDNHKVFSNSKISICTHIENIEEYINNIEHGQTNFLFRLDEESGEKKLEEIVEESGEKKLEEIVEDTDQKVNLLKISNY